MSCSYCNIKNHNKATCKNLFNDKILAIKKNQEYRKLVLEKFKDSGIGIGAMIEIIKSDKVFLIEKIEWDNILFKNSRPSLIVNIFGDRIGYNNIVVNKKFFEDIEQKNIQILLKAIEDHVGVGIPNDWLSGLSNLERAFPY